MDSITAGNASIPINVNGVGVVKIHTEDSYFGIETEAAFLKVFRFLRRGGSSLKNGE
jgi:hypothetical protein